MHPINFRWFFCCIYVPALIRKDVDTDNIEGSLTALIPVVIGKQVGSGTLPKSLDLSPSCHPGLPGYNLINKKGGRKEVLDWAIDLENISMISAWMRFLYRVLTLRNRKVPFKRIILHYSKESQKTCLTRLHGPSENLGDAPL
ncbi:PREDICTED: uncharacterized protein LOC105456538 [Wasmannia auropunctata]|uniref:uncharacterized protein LOC105456538 n=1 Tax=Wasmannia auropunctata TaxID=64793 RepID=UPI0005EFD21E|nr:PREDICTED: uncharacterized protein LOC105456538 [Wasmannia auropunctata]